MEEKHHELTESTGCAGVNLVGFISETKQLWRSYMKKGLDLQ